MWEKCRPEINFINRENFFSRRNVKMYEKLYFCSENMKARASNIEERIGQRDLSNWSCDTRGFTFSWGRSQGIIWHEPGKREREKEGKRKAGRGVITITGTDYTKRVDKYHDSTVVVAASRDDLRQSSLRNNLSAEITHWARDVMCVRIFDHTRACSMYMYKRARQQAAIDEVRAAY